MTTAESAAHMDTSSADYTGTEKKKPSLIKKVKAKAKKLKAKLKPGHHEAEHPDTQLNNENSSSASSSEGEEETHELGYTPLSEAVNSDDDKWTAHAGQKAPRDFEQLDQSGLRLGAGQAIPEEDRKFGQDKPDTSSEGVPLSQFKSPGPAGVEQAVPTSYNYYNQDPAAAYKTPSPAALGLGGDFAKGGEESTDATPAVPGSRAFGSDISGAGDKPFSGVSTSLNADDSNTAAADRSLEEDRDAKIPVGILAPGPLKTESSQGLDDDDSFSSGRDYSQDVGMATPSTKVTDSVAGAKDAALDKLGYGSTDDQSPTDDYSPEAQKPLHQRAYEGLTGAAVGMGQKLGAYRDYDNAPGADQTTSSSEPTVGQKMYDTVVGTKDAAADKLSGGQTGDSTMAQKAYDTIVGTKEAGAEKLGYNSQSTGTTQPEPTLTQKAYDTIVGTKDAASEKLGYNSQNTSQSGPTLTQKAYDTLVGTKDSAGEKLSGGQRGEPTTAQKAYDTIVGTKDAASEKLGYNSQNTSQSEPTLTQKAYDTLVGTKDAAADKVSGEQQATGEPTMTQKAYDTLAGVKDAAADKLGVQSGTASNNTFFNSTAAPVSEFGSSQSTDSKPVTEKVGETAANWKDSIAGTLGLGGTTTGTAPASDRNLTASTDQKPLTQKLTEAGVGLKETVASKLGYEGSSTNTPGEEMIRSAKDTTVDKGRQIDVGLSSDSTPVSQKATDSAYRAKDSTVSTLTPTEHDKALSQSVTDTISNLPHLLTEKLGLGGRSPTATTTKDFQGPSELDVPVSNSPSQLSTAAATPDSPAPVPTSPGVFNRMSDAVSSLFGGGGAKKPSAGAEEYSPTLSPSGSGHRDITDTSPMVTDVGGESTPRSSPAA